MVLDILANGIMVLEQEKERLYIRMGTTMMATG